MPESENAVPAVERALRIIDFLENKKGQATVKEISEGLEIPIVSASRIVKTLVSHGYLIENKGASSTYSLGLKFLHLSQVVLKRIEFIELARKHMSILSEETGQTSQLAVLQQNSVFYIEQILPKKPVSIIAPLHTPIALNTSASGKVLCAWKSREQQEAIVQAAELTKSTANSIVSKEQFYKELDRVRSTGYALDNEEFALGIGCIAAPIFDYTGQIIAAVGTTGHFVDYTKRASFDRLKNAILKAARNISREVGYPQDS